MRAAVAGQAELKLKTPWRDGITHPVTSLLEFMQRLAALVPRPQLLLIRFHGVLAPNAKPLPQVVPQGPLAQEEPATKAAATAEYDVGDRPGTVASHQLGAAAQAGLAIEGEMKIIAAIHEPSSGQ